MPDPPENGKWLAEAMGKVSCDTPGCPVCDGKGKLVSWEYRTSEVAYQGTDIPAAEEGEPFRHSLPDKEPDGESES